MIENDFEDIYRLTDTENLQLAELIDLKWMKKGARVLIRDSSFDGGFGQGVVAQDFLPKSGSDLVMVVQLDDVRAFTASQLRPLHLRPGTVVVDTRDCLRRPDEVWQGVVIDEERRDVWSQHLHCVIDNYRHFEALEAVLDKANHGSQVCDKVRSLLTEGDSGEPILKNYLQEGTPVAFASEFITGPIDPPQPQGVVVAVLPRNLHIVAFPELPYPGVILTNKIRFDELWFDYELIPLSSQQCSTETLQLARDLGFKP